MPEGASISKQMATQGYGAEVILHGRDLAEALEKARALEAQGYIFIHPYDDPEVMAGQGTLGLEILEDLPEVDTVVLPVGGGGLAAGVALAMKAQQTRGAAHRGADRPGAVPGRGPGGRGPRRRCRPGPPWRTASRCPRSAAIPSRCWRNT